MIYIGKGGKYMKKIVLFLCLCFIVLFCGCNNDSSIETVVQTPEKITDYTFIISVTSENRDFQTRGVSNKTEWSVGDVINLYIDNSTDNYCSISYLGDGQWEFNSANIPFSNNDGIITAIYSSTIQYENDKLQIGGDILYTEEGEYKKRGNIICITLNLNRRPLSKITIKGVNDGFMIDSLIQLNSFTSLSPITWSKQIESSLPFEYDSLTNTAIYYGLLDSNNDSTKLFLTNDCGYIYERSFNNTCTAGESIIIDGPLKSPDKWGKRILVQGISLNTSNVNLAVNDTYTLQATLQNENATNPNLIWNSSNPNVISINDQGLIEAKGRGNAIISVKSEDGSASELCYVTVADVLDFIDVKYVSNNASVGNDFSVSFDLIITNNYSKGIVLDKHISFSSTNVNILYSFDSSNFKVSFSSRSVFSGRTTKCSVSLRFVGRHTVYVGVLNAKQNYIHLDFTVNDTRYEKTVYLPWEIY